MPPLLQSLPLCLLSFPIEPETQTCARSPNSASEDSGLSAYRGKKAYLVVNVASECGYTEQNYAELQQLYEKYAGAGLEVLAIPANDFGAQEPGSNEQIQSFAQSKGATFTVTGKVSCSIGGSAHPLFAFLTNAITGSGDKSDLEWNFAKFLCDADGIPRKRYSPDESPLSFEADIVAML